MSRTNSQSSTLSDLACSPTSALSVIAFLYGCFHVPLWPGTTLVRPTVIPPPRVMQYCMTHLLQAARASTKKGISPATAHRNANRFGPLQDTVIFLASAFVIAAELGIPVHNVLMNAAVPVIPGFILILVASVVFLKLVSYVHCNWDLRYLNLLPLTWLVDAQKWVCASHDMCLTEACTT